jgi:hypothetical protein
MMGLEQPTGAGRRARGFGRGGRAARRLRTQLLAGLVVLLLASGMATGQAAAQPSLPDPCQMAPNLPYCP